MKCLKCGTEINENDKFCMTCGSAVIQNQQTINTYQTMCFPQTNLNNTGNVNNNQNKSKNKGKIILIIILCLIVIGVISFGAYKIISSHLKKSQDNEIEENKTSIFMNDTKWLAKDNSELIFKQTKLEWYKDAGIYDDNYYYATYEAYRGEDAIEYIISNYNSFGITESELNSKFGDSDINARENFVAFKITFTTFVENGKKQEVNNIVSWMGFITTNDTNLDLLNLNTFASYHFTKQASDNNNNNSNNSTISENWKDLEFIINNKKYKVLTSYSDMEQDGWKLKEQYASNTLDSYYKTFIVPIINIEFDSEVYVSFVNKTEETKLYKDCDFWQISIDNKWAKKPVSFELPKGIKNGSTLDEIEKAYGKPSENNIYRDDNLKFTKYIYREGYQKIFTLTVYDDLGLTKFEYEEYQ